MATTRVAIDEEYTKVADAGAWTSIQVVGVHQVDVIINASGAAAPLNTDNGFILRVLDAMLPTTFGDGDIYIKTRQADGVSSIAIFTE